VAQSALVVLTRSGVALHGSFPDLRPLGVQWPMLYGLRLVQVHHHLLPLGQHQLYQSSSFS
jgi:hypothetical protein